VFWKPHEISYKKQGSSYLFQTHFRHRSFVSNAVSENARIPSGIPR